MKADLKLEKIHAVLEEANRGFVSNDDFVASVGPILKAVKGVKDAHKALVGTVGTHEDIHTALHERVVELGDKVKEATDDFSRKIARVKAQKGDKGDRGDDGSDGEDGKDFDISMLKPEFIRNLLESFDDEDEMFDISRTKGWKGFTGEQTARIDRALSILDQRTQYLLNKKSSSGAAGVSSVVAGTGINVDNTDPANPIVSATGTSGITILIPTGSVNGTNTIFTFTSAPKVIVLDNGNMMNKVSSDGTTNWTGTTTITLNQAPSFNIFGL